MYPDLREDTDSEADVSEESEGKWGELPHSYSDVSESTEHMEKKGSSGGEKGTGGEKAGERASERTSERSHRDASEENERDSGKGFHGDDDLKLHESDSVAIALIDQESLKSNPAIESSLSSFLKISSPESGEMRISVFDESQAGVCWTRDIFIALQKDARGEGGFDGVDGGRGKKAKKTRRPKMNYDMPLESPRGGGSGAGIVTGPASGTGSAKSGDNLRTWKKMSQDFSGEYSYRVFITNRMRDASSLWMKRKSEKSNSIPKKDKEKPHTVPHPTVKEDDKAQTKEEEREEKKDGKSSVLLTTEKRSDVKDYPHSSSHKKDDKEDKEKKEEKKEERERKEEKKEEHEKKEEKKIKEEEKEKDSLVERDSKLDKGERGKDGLHLKRKSLGHNRMGSIGTLSLAEGGEERKKKDIESALEAWAGPAAVKKEGSKRLHWTENVFIKIDAFFFSLNFSKRTESF
jgi:hypothetical protein